MLLANVHPKMRMGWAFMHLTFSKLKLTSYPVPQTSTHHLIWGKHSLSGRFVIHTDNSDVCRGRFEKNVPKTTPLGHHWFQVMY